MNETNNQLPKDWNWVKLGEVCHTTSGGTPSRREPKYYNGNIPWVKSGELDKGLITDTEEKISEEAIKNSSAKIFPKGTLLIALYGATIGKLAFLGADAATNQAICGIYENEKINSHFLYNYLFYKKQKLVNQGIGGAQPNISQTILKNLDLPLPPKPAQTAIVSKIEELFSALDKGIENLRLAQQQLKTYRQAVLKWAFEGKLTNENVKEGELPRGWKWKRLGDMIDFVGGGTPSKSEKDYWNGNIFWASVKDVKGDYLNKTQDTITEKGLKNSASNLAEPGDVILITRICPGKSIISNVKSAINQDLKIAKPKFKTTSKFINYFFNAIERDCIKIASGTTVLGITLNSLNELEIPDLNIIEQNKIVQEIESRLSVADKMEESITQSLQQAEALRQSILKKAFEGRLINTEIAIVQLPKQAKVIPLKRKILAGKIIHLLNDDRNFGLTKFQKILYTVEHYMEADYNTNYLRDTAGPYDKDFTLAFRKEMEEKGWFTEEIKFRKTRFVPGDNVGSLIKEYPAYFREKGKDIVFVIQLLKDKTTHEAELIATLYAVWNNRLIKKLPIKEKELVTDFFNWSDKKEEEFQEKEILATYKWMKEVKLIPKGFGKFIG